MKLEQYNAAREKAISTGMMPMIAPWEEGEYNPNKLVVIQQRWLAPWQKERAQHWNRHFEMVMERQSLYTILRRWFRIRFLTLNTIFERWK
jgi:hypothetical protein